MERHLRVGLCSGGGGLPRSVDGRALDARARPEWNSPPMWVSPSSTQSCLGQLQPSPSEPAVPSQVVRMRDAPCPSFGRPYPLYVRLSARRRDRHFRHPLARPRDAVDNFFSQSRFGIARAGVGKEEDGMRVSDPRHRVQGMVSLYPSVQAPTSCCPDSHHHICICFVHSGEIVGYLLSDALQRGCDRHPDPVYAFDPALVYLVPPSPSLSTTKKRKRTETEGTEPRNASDEEHAVPIASSLATHPHPGSSSAAPVEAERTVTESGSEMQGVAEGVGRARSRSRSVGR